MSAHQTAGRHRSSATEPLVPALRPSFFIVGAAKCGTTALTTYLKRHPDVFMPAMPEPMFFGSDLYCAPRRRLTLDRYLRLFSNARDDQRIGECSTRYIVSRRAAEEIHVFEPDAKIIVMLRNPVEMMHSFHSQLIYSGEEEVEDFEAALAAEDARRQQIATVEPPPIPQVLVYRDVARYAEQVERYFSVFGRKRVHVVIFEEFVRDTQSEYGRVLQFLGVDPDFEPPFEVVNQYKAFRSKRVHDVLVRPPEPFRKLVDAMPSRVWGGILIRLRKLNTRQETRPRLPEALKRRLENDCADEIRRLETLLERDLSCWRSSAT